MLTFHTRYVINMRAHYYKMTVAISLWSFFVLNSHYLIKDLSQLLYTFRGIHVFTHLSSNLNSKIKCNMDLVVFLCVVLCDSWRNSTTLYGGG